MIRLLCYPHYWDWEFWVGNLIVLTVYKWRGCGYVMVAFWETLHLEFKWSPWCRINLFWLDE